MTRTLYPTIRRSIRIWQLYVPGEALYRILQHDTSWRLQERSVYGGPWQPVPDMDVDTFLAVHHCTLAHV